MTIRNAAIVVAMVFGVSVWAWSRPCSQVAPAPTPQTILTADASAGGGNQDDALARYRCNQSRHWRQVAIGN